MRLLVRASLVLACLTASPSAIGAGQAAVDDRGFVQGGLALVALFEQPNFGGYFCCDAGGVAPGFFVEAGLFVAPRLSVRGELAIPGLEIDDLSAPRFVQKNRHRDPTISVLLGVHYARDRRAGFTLLGGAGIAASRTARHATLIQFRPEGEVIDPANTTVINGNETRLAVTGGADVPIDLTSRVGLTLTTRLRWIDRSDDARSQDGLGPWLLTCGAALRIRF